MNPVAQPVLNMQGGGGLSDAMAQRYQLGNQALASQLELRKGVWKTGAVVLAVIGVLLILAAAIQSRKTDPPRATVQATVLSAFNQPYTTTIQNSSGSGLNTTTTTYRSIYTASYNIGGTQYSVKLSENGPAPITTGTQIVLQYDIAQPGTAWKCCKMTSAASAGLLAIIGVLMTGGSALMWAFRNNLYLVGGQNIRMT